MKPVLHSDPEELVPGGVELDLVDSLSEAVVRAQHGRVLVGEPAELERLTSAQPAEARAPPLGNRVTFAAKRLEEGPVLAEEVVVNEWRRLIRRT